MDAIKYAASPVTSVNGKTGVVVINKGDIGLGNVDNTSDVNKPISTPQQAALNLKENTIVAGTISQYWRGDKTWQTTPKEAIFGRIIFVDAQAANATDTRTGLSKYNLSYPFKTITAALSVYVSGDILFITGIYNESVSFPNILVIKLILDGCIINGGTSFSIRTVTNIDVVIFMFNSVIQNTGVNSDAINTAAVSINTGRINIIGDSRLSSIITSNERDV